MVAVFALGAVLAGRGELSVGEIVSFVGFANLLIAKLDQVSGFVTAVHRQAPVLAGYFAPHRRAGRHCGEARREAAVIRHAAR